MTGTEQTDQILLSTIEIGGSISIVNKLRSDIENQTDPTIQQPPFTSSRQPDRYTVTGTTSPSGVLIVVLMFPDTGGMLITALG